MRFMKKYADLILAGKKTLELRRFPPSKRVYTIQVGPRVVGRLVVKRAYRIFVPDMTEDQIRRAGFEDRVEAAREAMRFGLWPECWAWEIELLDARGAKRSARRGGPRPRHPKSGREVRAVSELASLLEVEGGEGEWS